MSLPPGDESMLECPIQDPDISSSVPVSGVRNSGSRPSVCCCQTDDWIVKFTDNRYICQYFCHGAWLLVLHYFKHIELTIQHLKKKTLFGHSCIYFVSISTILIKCNNIHFIYIYI